MPKGHLALLLCLVMACRSSGWAESPGFIRAWAEGPVRWLLLPEEKRQLRRIRSESEFTAFVREFWHRRDPTPEDLENPFAETFARRVEAADRLYGERDTRGSLTDRGRALILLGPPAILRHQQQEAPAWSPAHQRMISPMDASRRLTLEVWEYRLEDVQPGPRDQTLRRGSRREIRLTFLVGRQRTRLIQGEEILKDAVRWLVVEAPGRADR